MLDPLGDAATGVCACAALLAAGAAALGRRRQEALATLLLAALLAFLAVDRAFDLHDRVGYGIAGAAGLPRVDAWPAAVVYAPLLALIGWLLWRGVGLTPPPIARAGVVLLGLSLSMRPLALAGVLALGHVPAGRPRGIVVGAQETLALAGWLTVALAFVVAMAAAQPGRAASRPRAC
jgi:hypothetical protein